MTFWVEHPWLVINFGSFMKKERLALNKDPVGNEKPSTFVSIVVLRPREEGVTLESLCFEPQ